MRTVQTFSVNYRSFALYEKSEKVQPSAILLHPKCEEWVIDHVGALVGSDKVLVEQGPDGSGDDADRLQMVLLDEGLAGVSISGEFHQLLRLSHSVTEIVRPCIAFCYKRIVRILLILSAKIAYSPKLSKLG